MASVKQKNFQNNVRQFCLYRDYIRGENIIDPPSVKKVMGELAEEQNKLNDKRKEFVIQLRYVRQTKSMVVYNFQVDTLF